MKSVMSAMLAAAVTLAVVSVADAQPGGGRGQGGRGGFGAGGFGAGGFGGGAAGGAMLLGMPEVQKELNITDDQKELITEMQADLRQRGGQRPDLGNFRDLSAEERQARMEELRKQAEERNKQAEDALKAILNDTQFARYGELQLQRQGLGALTRPDIVEKLGLSTEQTEKIGEVRRTAREEGGRRPEGQAGQRPDFQALMAAARERQAKVEADTLAVLTADQKAKWEQLQGKKFEFPAPTFGRGQGGPGGQPGQRGQGGNRPQRGNRPGSDNNNNN